MDRRDLSCHPCLVACISLTHRYGIHGDFLKDGKLDLSELLEGPSAGDWAWARDFIRRRRWQEAFTYRETAPHEYTVREWVPDGRGSADFDSFVILIRRFGYADFYYQIRHLYWAVDDFKYWTMGWPVSETVVINRARGRCGGAVEEPVGAPRQGDRAWGVMRFCGVPPQ